MAITTKQFQKFTDLDLVWDFLVEIYEYKFLGQVPDFEEDVDKSWLEEKIEEAVLEHERRECVDVNVLRPYLRAKRMRNRDI